MITVKELTENPDGSADVLLDITPDGVKLLLQYGFTAVLLEVIENAKNDKCQSQTSSSDL